jgi:hypothetical protein
LGFGGVENNMAGVGIDENFLPPSDDDDDWIERN